MRSAESYINDAKAKFGNPKMSDRELGALLGGLASSTVSSARYGNMSDPLAMKVARVIGEDPGELLMVARLEREKNQDVRQALENWAKNVFSLMPSKAAPIDLVRGGVRVGARARSTPKFL